MTDVEYVLPSGSRVRVDVKKREPLLLLFDVPAVTSLGTIPVRIAAAELDELYRRLGADRRGAWHAPARQVEAYRTPRHLQQARAQVVAYRLAQERRRPKGQRPPNG